MTREKPCLAERIFWGVVFALLFACAYFACVHPVRGQEPCKPHPAVCRVWTRTNPQSIGTGTIIAADGRVANVLTARHVISDGRPAVTLADGRGYEAETVLADADSDVAVLKIADPGVEVLKMADADPTAADSLMVCGYGPDGQYARIDSRYRQRLSGDMGRSFSWIEVTGKARQGDSGGPIATADGRLVGIVSAADSGTSCGCGVSTIRRLLQWRVVRPSCPCPNGQCPQPCQPVAPIPSPQPLPVPTPTPLPIPPVPVVTPTPTVDLGPINAKIDALAQAVAALAAREPVPGPAGKDGSPGKDGQPGKDAQIDYPTLAAEVAKKLPPLYVQTIDNATGKSSVQVVPLGGTITHIHDSRTVTPVVNPPK